jgi:hypothetical protein
MRFYPVPPSKILNSSLTLIRGGFFPHPFKFTVHCLHVAVLTNRVTCCRDYSSWNCSRANISRAKQNMGSIQTKFWKLVLHSTKLAPSIAWSWLDSRLCSLLQVIHYYTERCLIISLNLRILAKVGNVPRNYGVKYPYTNSLITNN